MLRSAGDGHATVGNDSLPRDEGARARGQKHRNAADVIGLADAPERRQTFVVREHFGIFPERARKIGLEIINLSRNR